VSVLGSADAPAITLAVAAAAAWLLRALARRRVFTWLPGYLRGLARPRPRHAGPRHVIFCFVDHFEPGWGGADPARQRARVRRWREGYPRLCAGHRDADGRPPRHTFFFPAEEYRPEHLDDLAELCRAGYGEIEVHLHHDRDTAEGLRARLRAFVQALAGDHGVLPLRAGSGRPAWAFVHGNWALDNARPDGRWCGVDDELTVLAEEGCYADFTLPSAPDVTQTRTVNSIYYAADDPARPKSHDTGEPVRAGGVPRGDLVIVQGPLGLNWRWRKHGILPRIENGEIRASSPPRPDRTDLWVRTHVHVAGRPDWVFVKVHTHGAPEREGDAVLGPATEAMFRDLESRYNDGRRHVLHYVTAREMYNIVKAAEAGLAGDPGQYRDFCIPAPAFDVPARVGLEGRPGVTAP
jgi:hypothetical protein